MKRYLTPLFIALTMLFPASGHALYIRDYLQARDNRFYTGSDKAFVGASYDFSGVGYNNGNKWATLVGNNYFLSSSHLHPGTGDSVTFYSTNSTSGPSYSYTVTGGVQIAGTDLWLGWFDSSVNVNSSIARYSIEMLSTNNNYAAYKNQILYNYGRDSVVPTTQLVGRNVLDKVIMTSDQTSTGLAAWYDYDGSDTPSVGGDESYLTIGDSGAPSFAVVGSKLTLIGIHWARTSNTIFDGVSSIDTFVPAYFADVNAIMSSRSQSVMAVPEPNVYWYMPVLMIGIMLDQKRHATARFLAKNKHPKTSGRNTSMVPKKNATAISQQKLMKTMMM
jgi:hypothetical protein